MTYLEHHAHFSNSISSSMGRPNTVPLTDNVLARANAVCRTDESDAEELIVPLLRYQRLMEDVFSVNRTARKADDASLLHTHAPQLVAALDAWWATLTMEQQGKGESSA